MKRPTSAFIGRNVRKTYAKSGKPWTSLESPRPTTIAATRRNSSCKGARLKIVVSPVRVRVSPSENCLLSGRCAARPSASSAGAKVPHRAICDSRAGSRVRECQPARFTTLHAAGTTAGRPTRSRARHRPARSTSPSTRAPCPPRAEPSPHASLSCTAAPPSMGAHPSSVTEQSTDPLVWRRPQRRQTKRPRGTNTATLDGQPSRRTCVQLSPASETLASRRPGSSTQGRSFGPASKRHSRRRRRNGGRLQTQWS
jgi:hypothetical protein